MQIYKLIAIYGAALMMSVVATWLDQTTLYMMAGSLGGLLLVAYVGARWGLRGITVERLLPGQVEEGELVQTRLTVRNSGRLRRSWVTMSEELPAEMMSTSVSDPVPLMVPPLGEAIATFSFRPRRFGRYRFQSAILDGYDPMGLFDVSIHARTAPADLLVLPSPLPLRVSSVFSRGSTGINQTDAGRWKGFGAEPHTVREYIAGDALRRIHWRTSARRSKLHVLEFESGYIAEVAIAIDFERSGDFGVAPDTTFCRMVRNAAFIIKEALESGSSVRLLGQSVPAEDSIEGTGERHYHRIMSALAEARCESEWPLADALMEEVDKLPYNGTLFIMTALGDLGLADMIARLHRRHVHPILLLYEESEPFGIVRRAPTFRTCNDPEFLEQVVRAGAQAFFVGDPVQEGVPRELVDAHNASR